jgi:transcriptional regulator with XRE-family HTH domain
MLRYVISDAYINEAVAAELKAAHTAEGLTRKQLSAATGIPMVSLERFLNAKRDINVRILGLIAAASNADPAEIMERATRRAARLAAAASEAGGNVTAFPTLNTENTGEIDMYRGDKAAYRDPEADEDEQ